MDMGKVITIDGPAASGKTSVSRELARRLGWKWVSTGAFYRGLALVAREIGVSFDDEEALAELASRRDLWQIEMGDDQTKIFFQGRDVTDLSAHEDVGNIASKISHFPRVRGSLLEPQRQCREMPEGLVAEGRDCGTVVFPDAEAKVYLTASQENRAARRARELGLSREQTAAAQKVRDHQDSTRKAAPLQVPAEALVIDTTLLNFNEVVDRVYDFVEGKVAD